MATFTVRGRNMEVTPALKDYVEKRVGKIAKYFDKVGEITVLLTVSKGRHTVEVTVPIDKGVMLRGDDVSKVEIIGVYRRRLKLVCDEIEQRRVVPEGSWQGAERAFQHPGAGKRF